MRMYRIYDSKAESFSNPFYEHTDASAQRAFIEAVRNPSQSGMNGHPVDYTLVHVGELLHDQALPIPAAGPTSLLTGTEALTIAREQAQRDAAEHAKLNPELDLEEGN